MAHIAIEGDPIRIPTTARVEKSLFTSQFNSLIPLHQVEMSDVDYVMSEYFTFQESFCSLLCSILHFYV
jgi:hypothetical protein